MSLLRKLFPAVSAGAGPRVFYGWDRLPAEDEAAHGGMVKFQKLAAVHPNRRRGCNVVYLGSSSRPADWREILARAAKDSIPVLYNQNGVAYPAWHGPGWEKTNEPMAALHSAASHVVYQSEFCRLSAEKFLGARAGSWEILYNPVDTAAFFPAAADPDPKSLVLLSAGSCNHFYRFEAAARTLAALAEAGRPARLIVAGRLGWRREPGDARAEADKLLAELRVADRAAFLPPYTQREAPDVYRRAHILLHAQYNDACPTTVLEAMACGLPVVFSRSGGTPELVGEAAGRGVAAPLSWEERHPPEPAALARETMLVADARAEYSAAARARAERFGLKRWIARHGEIFEALLARRPPA